MAKLFSAINPSSDVYQRNFAHHQKLRQQWQDLILTVQGGGGPLAQERHRARGKLLVRERIDQVLDAQSPFLELSALAAYQVYEDEVPAAGIVCGIGLIHQVPCMIVANDATVKGGTYYPLTVKKHLRAQKIAQQHQLPCIYLVDSGGAFLPLQAEVFPDHDHFGRIFFQQAQMSAQGIVQIAVVLGSCTAGGAYVPAMSDESIIVQGNGTIFLAGPPLVAAATGEQVSAQELGGAQVHTWRSGLTDHRVENEGQALALVREIIASSGVPKINLPAAAARGPFAAPAYPAESIYGVLPIDDKTPLEAREIIARLVDSSDWQEFKPEYGATLVCGFAHIYGHLVGILANNGVLFAESAQKGAHFIQLCDQRGIPLIFLQNITGFMVGKKYEEQGIAKEGAKLVNAVACAQVPKYTVLIGGSYGAGNYGMCGRAYEPRFLWSWPNARIGVMGAEQAALVLAQVKNQGLQAQGLSGMGEADYQNFVRPILEKYQQESSAFYATARLWDDGIIDPGNTREVLGLALALAAWRAPAAVTAGAKQSRNYGIFRM